MNFKATIAIASLIAISGYAHVHSHKCSHDHTVGRVVPNAPDSHPPVGRVVPNAPDSHPPVGRVVPIAPDSHSPVGRVVPNAPRRLEDKPPYQHTHSQLPNLSASLPLCSSALKTDSHPQLPTPNYQLSTINSQLQKSLGLKTVQAEMRRIASTVSFAGRYELNPDARKIVSSPVPGRLALLVRQLSDVKKGDALFTVTSPDLVARARDIAALEKRLAVYREIKTPNAALENELAVKRAERESMLAGAEEKDGVVTVRAAADGMVESLPAKDGSWLETGSAAVQTVRTRDLRFTALATSSDVIRLKDGMPAKVDGHSGRIRIGIGNDSGIVPVYVLFDSEPDAFAGKRGRAECVTDESEEPQLAVPSKAVVQIGVRPVIFVKDAHNPERFHAMPVTPGISGGGWTAITPLLHSSTSHNSPLSTLNSQLIPEVVTDGAYELKLALPTGNAAKPAGHFHADGTFHEGEH